jgi:hypothetical protein
MRKRLQLTRYSPSLLFVELQLLSLQLLSLLFATLNLRPAVFASIWPTMSAGKRRAVSPAGADSQPSHLHAAPLPARAAHTAVASAAERLLYAHALESIFKFSGLKELSALLCVSKSWQKAVLSMEALHAVTLVRFPVPLVQQLCASRLRRHVQQLWISDSMVCPAMVNRIAEQMPQLHELGVSVLLDALPLPQLCFPTQARRVDFGCELFRGSSIGQERFAFYHAALVAIADLPELAELSLSGLEFFTSVSLAPLQRKPLRQLSLNSSAQTCDNLIEQTRSMAQVQSLILLAAIPLRTLLAPGHQLWLHTLSIAQPHRASLVELQDVSALAASRMSTLTSLTLLSMGASSLHFLAALPQLRTLSLFFHPSCPAIAAADVVAALQELEQLTELQLWLWPHVCQLTAAQWAQVLPRMSQLRSLQLQRVAGIDSLSFLAGAPRLRRLSLGVFHLRLSVDELLHVHQLLQLDDLQLTDVFNEAIHPFIRQLYTPPSPLVPSLTHMRM